MIAQSSYRHKSIRLTAVNVAGASVLPFALQIRQLLSASMRRRSKQGWAHIDPHRAHPYDKLNDYRQSPVGDNMRLTGKVALITGAGSGIGAAVAKLFAAEGARVYASDIDLDAAERIVREITGNGGEARAAGGDITSSEIAERTVADTSAAFGRLDILVNSAGVTPRNALSGADWESIWDRVIEVNLKGSYLMSRFAAEAMKRAGGGSIINLGSVIALVGYAEGLGLSDGFSAYPQSKGAVLQLTRDMGVNLAKFGIRTNCLCPGFIKTNLTKDLTADPEKLPKLEASHPMGRLGTADEVAKAALFLASDDASFITGAVLTVDGGYTAQ